MPDIQLSVQTQRRLNALFSGPEREAAAQLLIAKCGDNLPFAEGANEYSLERIRFAALKLSNGDLAGLQDWVQHAQVDSRDLLMEAGFGHDVHAHHAWFPDDPAAGTARG